MTWMTRYCALEHQNKANPYIQALTRIGYYPHKRIDKETKFLLIDREWGELYAGKGTAWRKEIIEVDELGIPVFIYPHSARPNIPYDFIPPKRMKKDCYPAKVNFTIAS